MTDKEKLERIKKLADGMYYAAQYLTTDASRLRKAMEEYHKFIIYEYNKQEPASEDLEKECSQYFENWTVQDDLGLTKPDGWSCIVKDLYDIAKHFFELGLKVKQD